MSIPIAVALAMIVIVFGMLNGTWFGKAMVAVAILLLLVIMIRPLLVSVITLDNTLKIVNQLRIHTFDVVEIECFYLPDESIWDRYTRRAKLKLKDGTEIPVWGVVGRTFLGIRADEEAYRTIQQLNSWVRHKT